MICAVIFCTQIMITPRFAAILAGMLAEATSTFHVTSLCGGERQGTKQVFCKIQTRYKLKTLP